MTAVVFLIDVGAAKPGDFDLDNTRIDKFSLPIGLCHRKFDSVPGPVACKRDGNRGKRPRSGPRTEGIVCLALQLFLDPPAHEPLHLGTAGDLLFCLTLATYGILRKVATNASLDSLEGAGTPVPIIVHLIFIAILVLGVFRHQLCGLDQRLVSRARERVR